MCFSETAPSPSVISPCEWYLPEHNAALWNSIKELKARTISKTGWLITKSASPNNEQLELTFFFTLAWGEAGEREVDEGETLPALASMFYG